MIKMSEKIDRKQNLTPDPLLEFLLKRPTMKEELWLPEEIRSSSLQELKRAVDNVIKAVERTRL